MASAIARQRTPALGEFLDTLEARLRGLGPEGTVTALLAHAQRLPASARQDFLTIFPDTATPTTAPDGDRLLADIDTFAQRAHDGEFSVEDDDDDDWYYDRDDDEYRTDAEWIAEADTLFAAAADEFLASRLDEARQAYQRLFGVFRPSHEGGGDLELWRLQDTDLGEAAARYLRCVYDTAPARQRVHAVHPAAPQAVAGGGVRHQRGELTGTPESRHSPGNMWPCARACPAGRRCWATSSARVAARCPAWPRSCPAGSTRC